MHFADSGLARVPESVSSTIQLGPEPFLEIIGTREVECLTAHGQGSLHDAPCHQFKRTVPAVFGSAGPAPKQEFGTFQQEHRRGYVDPVRQVDRNSDQVTGLMALGEAVEYPFSPEADCPT